MHETQSRRESCVFSFNHLILCNNNMYVCMYVCLFVCLFVCLYVCMYVCLQLKGWCMYLAGLLDLDSVILLVHGIIWLISLDG